MKINNPKQNPKSNTNDKGIPNSPDGFYPGILDSDLITMYKIRHNKQTTRRLNWYSTCLKEKNLKKKNREQGSSQS
jgi:hypothetical protein